MTDHPIVIPAAFAEKMRATYADRGETWLRALPGLLADLATRWGLILGEPFDLSYNYVVAARRADGSEVVLKVGFPHHELEREIRAMRLYAGEGTCRLLESDEAHHAMLLERLQPGERLEVLAREDDDAATRIGVLVMRQLWRPVPEDLPAGHFEPIANWFARAFARHRKEYGGPGPFPAAVLERAERLAGDLLAAAPSIVLLHGDFHHYNVLSAERAPWLAIDPKGMTGDPGYEVGPLLMNPYWGGSEIEPSRVQRRLDILSAELAYDRERLRAWGIAHAVLSACWSAEERGSDWEKGIRLAELLIG